MESPIRSQIVYLVGRSRSAGTQLGRRRLADATGLTEMAVRLQLERLRDDGWVDLGRTGVTLTDPGRARFAELFDRIRAVREPELTSLRVDDLAAAGLVATRQSHEAWAVRDLAVREGATGLLLLRLSPDGWRFSHDDEPVSARNPIDAATLLEAFPEAAIDDRLVVAFAQDRATVGRALWRALAQLLMI